MEGDEDTAMNIVTVYRGLLGGTGVALSSTILNNYWKKEKRLLTFRSFRGNAGIIALCPLCMLGIRYLQKVGQGDEEKDQLDG